MNPHPRSLSLLCCLYVGTASGVLAQGSPCLSNADTASAHIGVVTRSVTFLDSALLASEGLPYRPPDGVVLVTDSTICRALVDAKNALIPAGDTIARVITRAYVFTVGTTAYVLVPENNEDLYVYFDRNYAFLAAKVALR
jgi:hypothetical protein